MRQLIMLVLGIVRTCRTADSAGGAAKAIHQVDLAHANYPWWAEAHN